MKNILIFIATLVFSDLIFDVTTQAENSCINFIFSPIADNTGLSQCFDEFLSGFPSRQVNSGRIPVVLPDFTPLALFTLKSTNGKLTGVESVIRSGDAIKTSGEEATELSATIRFNNIAITYDYEASSFIIASAGKVMAALDNLVAKVVFDIQPDSINIQQFDVIQSGTITFQYSGNTVALLLNLISGVFATGIQSVIPDALRNLLQADVNAISSIG